MTDRITTNRPETSDPIWKLVDAVINDTISEVESQQLTSILETDPIARRLFLDYCELHVGIWLTIESSQATQEALERIHQFSQEREDEEATTEAAGAGAPSTLRLADAPPPLWRRLLTTPLPTAAVIAIVATTAVLLSSLWSLGMLRWPTTGETEVATKIHNRKRPRTTATYTRPVVATLTGQVDCRWAKGTRAPKYGEPLHAKRLLDLESGMAQVTYESGAKLIVQGPAQFRVVSEMEGLLNVGKISAVVPKSAHGFTVRSPSAAVVDLGTEFGMYVRHNGDTEVHVFNGEVVSWQLDQYGKITGNNLHVTERESMTYGTALASPKLGLADASKFIREVAVRLSDDELPPLPVKDHLALWLAADTLVRTDKRNRVIAWRDILTGDNQTDEDAWQYMTACRPLLVENAIGGKPALRFDGQMTYLITTPLTTTDDQTVLIVFSQGKGATGRPIGGQLLNYNGPPHRYHVNWGVSQGVFQIGDMDQKAAPFSKVGLFRGYVFSGRENKRAINVGQVYTRDRLEDEAPAVCTYVYNEGEGKAELFLNGASQGTATAPTPIAVTSRKVIGRHGAQQYYFLGDIAEVLIYNTALPKSQIAQVNHYLTKKYNIQ